MKQLFHGESFTLLQHTQGPRISSSEQVEKAVAKATGFRKKMLVWWLKMRKWGDRVLEFVA